MNESKKADMFRIIAAVCFLLSTIFEIKYACYLFVTGAYGIKYDCYLFVTDAYMIDIVPILVHCIASLSIFLLFILNLNKKNIGCLIASGICAVAHFIWVIYYFIEQHDFELISLKIRESKPNFLWFLAYSSFCFFLLIDILPSLSKMKSKMLIFVFVSVGLFLIAHFVYADIDIDVKRLFFALKDGRRYVDRAIREIPSDIKEYLAVHKDNVISDVFISLGIVFTGSWFWEIYRKSNPKLLSKKAVSTQPDLYGGAEKLETLKELLDSGAITQEEFDEKKKQILNL